MEPTFELGNRAVPKGHALLYFRSTRDPDAVWATYLVVPPVAMDLAKYVPPMFANQFPLQGLETPAAYPLPPVPEKVAGHQWLVQTAEARQDDLLDGGTLDPEDLQRAMLAVAEAAQRYAQLCAERSQPTEEPSTDRGEGQVDVDDLLLSVLSESEKVGKLARLVGSLRYATEGGDAATMKDALREIEQVGKHLHAKYRVDDLMEALQLTGDQAWTLAELYIERAYKLAAEEYAALDELERRIRSVQGRE